MTKPRTSSHSTLAASAIGTIIGTGAWFFGAKAIWPAHPLTFCALVTIVTTIAIQRIWPVDDGQEAPSDLPLSDSEKSGVERPPM